MALLYRLRQFWQAGTAGPLPESAFEEIAGTLDERQVMLFSRFQDSDQQHSFHVWQLLKDRGHDNPDLLTAALLHDIGKVRVSLRPWERALIVVGKALWPQRAVQWGSGAARGWRRPFVVRRRHPQWGAEMAAEAGVSPTAVRLIRVHQDEELAQEDADLQDLLRLLQWADDQS